MARYPHDKLARYPHDKLASYPHDKLASYPHDKLARYPHDLIALCLIGIVRAYQYTLRPVIGAQCRFEPHCSAYAIDALRAHGAVRGTWLTARRVLRCNPWHPGGHDPVPSTTVAH